MENVVIILTVLGAASFVFGLLFSIFSKTRKVGIKMVVSGLIVAIVGFVSLVAFFTTDDSSNNQTSEEVSTATETEDTDPTISKEQYESVEIGETLEQIKKELGEVSEDNISTVDGGPMWTYSNDDLGLAYIYFSKDENKVVKKRELGILSENSDTETTKDGIVDNNDWNTKIKQIAVSEKTETEKFDEVSELASNYILTDDELKDFEDYIINEYKTKNYLKDINNDEYMLTNIFKSTAVEKNYDDAEKEAIDSFAFDFLQNTKYTYRGAETIDSQFVKANESQMEKALAFMN